MEFLVGQKVKVSEVKRGAHVDFGDIGEIKSIKKLEELDAKECGCNYIIKVYFEARKYFWLFGEDELKPLEVEKTFKIGDKIRCIKSERCACIKDIGLDGLVGECGVIVSGEPNSWDVRFDTDKKSDAGTPLNKYRWSMCENDMELIKEFL